MPDLNIPGVGAITNPQQGETWEQSTTPVLDQRTGRPIDPALAQAMSERAGQGAVFAGGGEPAAAAPAAPGPQGLITPEQLLQARLQPQGGGRGGPRVTQTTTQELNQPIPEPLNQALAQQEQQAQGQLEESVRAGAETQAAGQRGAGQVLDDLQAQLAERQQAFDQRRQQARAKFQDAVAKYKKLSDEVSNLKVDPDRYFARRGTGARVVAAIAAGLGGVGAALTGGRNVAVDMIQKAIDRDIDAQRANIAQKTKQLGTQGNLLQQMRQVFDDDQAAEMATRAAMIGRAQMQIKSLGARTNSQLVTQHAEQALAELDVQKAAAQRAAAQRMAGVTTRQTQQRSGGGGGRRVSVGQALRETATDVKAGREIGVVSGGEQAGNGALSPDLVPLTPEAAGDVVARRTASGALASAQNTRDSMREYRAVMSRLNPAQRAAASALAQMGADTRAVAGLASQVGPVGLVMNADTFRAAQLFRGMAANLAAIQNNGRAPTDADVELAMGQLPGPSDPDLQGSIDRISSHTENAARNQIRALGWAEPNSDAGARLPASFEGR